MMLLLTTITQHLPHTSRFEAGERKVFEFEVMNLILRCQFVLRRMNRRGVEL